MASLLLNIRRAETSGYASLKRVIVILRLHIPIPQLSTALLRAMYAFHCSVLAFLFGVLPSQAAVKAATGKFIGPGGGGSLFDPTVSAMDPNHVFVACDMTGAYYSADGGRSWRQFNLRGRVRFFALDPRDPKVVYAKSIGLWRSMNAGVTWSLIYPDPADVTEIQMHGDHAAEKLATRMPRPAVVALAVDPDNSKVLDAVLEDRQSSSFSVSKDRGKSWKTAAPAPQGTHHLFVDPTPGRKDRSIYLVGTSSIAARIAGQWTSRPLPPGVRELSDVSVGFSEGGSATLYLVADGVLFVSSDGGSSWRKSSLPGDVTIRAIAASPDHPTIAYASFRAQNPSTNTVRTLGVVRTRDGGTTWTAVRSESGSDHKAFGDDWIGESFGSGYAAAPIALSVAPKNPMIVYSTDAGRILRSDDAGEHWTAIYSSRLADGSFSGTGLEATTSHGVHFDPFNPKRIFISYTDIGLFRSENGGLGWLPSTNGVPHAWRNTTYWITFDPAVRGRAWAVMSGTHDLPRTKMFGRKSPSTYQGGVMISDDGGRNWQKSNQGMDPTAPTHILLDPGSPPDARVLYVSACGRGVYKSSDGGKSWELRNNGIIEKEPLAFRIIRDSAGGLYVILARRGEEAPPGSSDDGALYHSTDAAGHWKKIALPVGVNGPNGMAIDPRNPERLYLAAWGRFEPGGQEGGGIYLSTDRGKTWRHVLTEDQHIFDVTIDNHSPDLVYASGFESSAWRSKDSGLNWQRISGFNFKWGQRVIMDPVERHKIYITTFGGGVWHGPAEGDRHTVDEISTPKVAHSRRDAMSAHVK
jgi:photosystem II stability/assembly factor-like uncharacterized protein